MRTHDELVFPFSATTPSVARTKLAAFLTVNHVSSPVIDDALIVLSEMLANAVCHGGPRPDGKLAVAWELRPPVLELHVADGGDGGSFEPQIFDEDSLSGRGLAIINKVAKRWWVDDFDGTSVHAEIALR
ncbi:MAG: hypothetical protein JWP10_1177 [Nocardioidaceae bacterium]|nr:hypothetical protein [Nocardioidaceae bacterium]